MSDERIQAQAEAFGASPAYTRLHAQLAASSRKGMSSTFGATRLLTWWMAGRIMWTFERLGGSVTLVSRQRPPSGCGLNACTLPAHEAIAAIIEVMTTHGDMHDDPDVTLDVLQ